MYVFYNKLIIERRDIKTIYIVVCVFTQQNYMKNINTNNFECTFICIQI